MNQKQTTLLTHHNKDIYNEIKWNKIKSKAINMELEDMQFHCKEEVQAFHQYWDKWQVDMHHWLEDTQNQDMD